MVMAAPQPVVQAPATVMMSAPVPAPVPVSVTPGPVIPAPPATMQAGPAYQVKGVGMTQKLYEQATMSVHNTTTMQTKVVAPPQMVAGQSYEVEGATQTLNFDQEQMVAGQTHTNTVEIPTVQEIVQYQDIPEMQVREMIQEVPQIETVPKGGDRSAGCT